MAILFGNCLFISKDRRMPEGLHLLWIKYRFDDYHVLICSCSSMDLFKWYSVAFGPNLQGRTLVH